MPSAVATATGITGPGKTVTSLALPNVTRIDFQVARGVVSIYYGNNQMMDIDYVTTVTVTDTISGTVSTFVVST